MSVNVYDSLTGTLDTIAGAQNGQDLDVRVTAIESKIPSSASSTNKLVAEDSLGTASEKDYTDVVRVGLHDLVESNAVANAINQALSSIYVPRGALSCAELTSGLLIEANVGNVYEMSDSGTTSALFIQGAGTTISVGDNVGIIKAGQNTYMFNYMGNAFDLTEYAKKPSTYTANNLASLDANGNLADSGLAVSDYVGDGNMNPVTSNAVFDEFATRGDFLHIGDTTALTTITTSVKLSDYSYIYAVQVYSNSYYTNPVIVPMKLFLRDQISQYQAYSSTVGSAGMEQYGTFRYGGNDNKVVVTRMTSNFVFSFYLIK